MSQGSDDDAMLDVNEFGDDIDEDEDSELQSAIRHEPTGERFIEHLLGLIFGLPR